MHGTATGGCVLWGALSLHGRGGAASHRLRAVGPGQHRHREIHPPARRCLPRARSDHGPLRSSEGHHRPSCRPLHSAFHSSDARANSRACGRAMIGACVTAILVLVGVFAAASAASGQTLFRSDGLVAYDSTGKRVGTLSYAPNREVTFRTGAGRTVIVSVTPSYLFGNAVLYFPRAGCSGRPFLTRPNTGGQGGSFVGGPRQTVHVQEGAFSRRAMRSTRSPDGRCFNSAST